MKHEAVEIDASGNLDVSDNLDDDSEEDNDKENTIGDEDDDEWKVSVFDPVFFFVIWEVENEFD